MGRARGRVSATLGAVVSGAVGAVLLVTALPASAGDAPDMLETGMLETGLLYESSTLPEQKVDFYVLNERSGRATELVLTIDVRCGKGIQARGVLRASVDGAGRIRASGRVSGSDGDDTFTIGSAELRGRVARDGTAGGTVSFGLTELEQTEEEDVRGRCKEEDAEWAVRAGEPDAAIARLRGARRLPAKLGDRVSVKALAADDDSVYVGTATGFDGAPFGVARIDAESGALRWSEEIDREPLALTLGDGAVWATTEKSVVRVDADSGKTTETIDATSVAVAPDGAVWVRTEDENDLRRLDAATGRELERREVGELFGFGPMLAAGVDGVYTRVLVPNPAETGAANLDLLIRLDPATGEVTRADATNEGGGVNQIEVTDAALWLATTTGVEQRDPATLAFRAANGEVYPAYGVAAASPGLWVADYGAVHAVDATDVSTAFTIPALGGPIAATPDTVWVHDDTFGLVRIAAG